jgi:hypothetical protein
MTETTWGTASQGISETQWRTMMGLAFSDGVVKSYLSGNEVYANSTGMRVFVRSGVGTIRGAWHSTDADVELSITNNGSGNPRIDLVVLRLNDTTDTVSYAVVEGTPAATPSAPTPSAVNPYEIPLAYVAVANSAATIAAGDVTDRRKYASANATGRLRGRALRSSNQPINNNTDTTITWTGVGDFTSAGFWLASAPTQLIIPETGYYDLNSSAMWAEHGTGLRRMRVFKAGVDILIEQTLPAVGTGGTLNQVTRKDVPLAAGDLLTMVVWQTSTTTLNVISYGSGVSPYLAASRQA